MPETIYYDGHCGLCHGFVKFVLARDPLEKFHFAPLDKLPAAERALLPESVVVRSAQGGMLTKSTAALHVMQGLSGGWPLVARVGLLFPRAFRDLVYDQVARIRYRVFGRREESCPLIPREMRHRFEAS